MRRLKDRRDQYSGEKNVDFKQTAFSTGLVVDIPASQIPGDALAKAYNVDIEPLYLFGRNGSRLWSDTPLPTLSTGMTFSRSGNTVTKVLGRNLSVSDIGNYIVWPEGQNDEIIDVLSTTKCKTRQSGDRADTPHCSMRGKVWANETQESLSMFMIQIDERVFVSDVQISDWNRAYCVSYELPNMARSKIVPNDNYGFLFNSYGIYKLSIDTQEPYIYKINSMPPDDIIVDVLQDDDKTYGWRYLYSMSKLIAPTYHFDRHENPDEVVIEQESGTTIADENSKDYGETFLHLPIGYGSFIHGELRGANGVTLNVPTWSAITNATIGMTMNGKTHNLQMNFVGVTSLQDVARRFQIAMESYWPTAKVNVETAAGGTVRFVVETGDIDGYYLNYATAGVGGTDVSGAGYFELTAAAGAILNNSAPYDQQNIIGDLHVGSIPSSFPKIIERHWTHYSLYRTLEIGPIGIENGNNTETYIFLKDIPIMKAFTASRTGNVITASLGIFGWEDIGSTILFQNGTTAVITGFVGYGYGFPYGVLNYKGEAYTMVTVSTFGAIASQSAVLAASTVMTVTQLNYTVTRVSGTRSFVKADERKSLFFADGSYTWITEYIDGNHVKVLNIASKIQQGAAIDPVKRKFCDITTDKDLENRIEYFSLTQRGWRELPNGDIGDVGAGFIAISLTQDSKWYYSQIGSSEEYLAGYHRRDLQYDDKVTDGIVDIVKYPDLLIIKAQHSFWYVPTTTLDPSTTILKLPGAEIIDNIGMPNRLASDFVDISNEVVFTSEPAVRIFDGRRFGSENLCTNRVQNIIEHFDRSVIVGYAQQRGIFLWATKKGGQDA